MIIETQDDVTRAVLAEMHRTPDARTKELLSALVSHLHAFVRETRMTEKEFQAAIVGCLGHSRRQSTALGRRRPTTCSTAMASSPSSTSGW